MPRSVLMIVALALAAGCGDDSPTGPSDSPDAPVEITEVFPSDEPGSLTPSGGITHTFPVQRAGRITVTLTSLAPDPEGTIGLNLGTWNGIACVQHITRDDATQGTTIVGEATGSGNYCIRVYDAAGTLAGPVQYQVTVTHF